MDKRIEDMSLAELNELSNKISAEIATKREKEATELWERLWEVIKEYEHFVGEEIQLYDDETDRYYAINGAHTPGTLSIMEV